MIASTKETKAEPLIESSLTGVFDFLAFTASFAFSKLQNLVKPLSVNCLKYLKNSFVLRSTLLPFPSSFSAKS
jgi:hypothetical protein